MAVKHWKPKASAVKQISTVQITADDANTTYTITINGIDVSVAGSGTGVNDTAAALDLALNLSTHPYFTAVSWTSSTDTVTGTSITAGEPFTATSSATGGTGTIGSVTTTTAADGPNHLNNADNWGGTLPANSDELVFANSSINALWELDALTTTGHTVRVEQSFLGLIGLRSDAFLAVGAENTAAPEYRADYLQLDISRLEIGQHNGPGSPSGSQRIKIDNDRASASTTVVYNTAGSAAEAGLPPVRLLLAHSSADLDVRAGPGGVGVAMDEPDETSTAGDITLEGGNVFLSNGVTFTNFTQQAGNSKINAAATVTSLKQYGGVAITEGSFAITTVDQEAGLLVPNSTGTITTLNVAGQVDGRQSGEARTWSTVNLKHGSNISLDTDVVTISTLTPPTNGGFTLNASL